MARPAGRKPKAPLVGSSVPMLNRVHKQGSASLRGLGLRFVNRSG